MRWLDIIALKYAAICYQHMLTDALEERDAIGGVARRPVCRILQRLKMYLIALNRFFRFAVEDLLLDVSLEDQVTLAGLIDNMVLCANGLNYFYEDTGEENFPPLIVAFFTNFFFDNPLFEDYTWE